MKYVLILGKEDFRNNCKGRLAACIGNILSGNGTRCTYVKLNSMLNTDAGQLSPAAYKEIYVLNDGTETFSGCGEYERLNNTHLTKYNEFSLGKVMYSVITGENNLNFFGSVFDFEMLSKTFDDMLDTACNTYPKSRSGKTKKHVVAIIDVDLDENEDASKHVLTAMLRKFEGVNNDDIYVIMMHNTEEKSQTAVVKQMHRYYTRCMNGGFTPDTVAYHRSLGALEDSPSERFTKMIKKNKGTMHHIQTRNAFEMLHELAHDGFMSMLYKKLNLKESTPIVIHPIYQKLMEKHPKRLKIGLITRSKPEEDAFLSLVEALVCGGKVQGYGVDVVYLTSADPDKVMATKEFKELDGIVCPGGFGSVYYENKLVYIHYAKTNKIPFLGICLGMQLVYIERFRDELEKPTATSEEFVPTTQVHAIKKIPNIKCQNTGKGIFLGLNEVELVSIGKKIYGKKTKSFKFRHSYGINIREEPKIERAGLTIGGKTKDGRVVILADEKHPFFVATQYHPELTSTPGSVDAVIVAFINSLLKRKGWPSNDSTSKLKK
ncbi:PYRG [Enterospora canceri]|uniref:CTP synthase n=1 Tax=Enterospora canceri TaxID=1081671 RepID=A0A1Y1S638_9MICR|nr:PYRG [Enterospora canceri]